MSVLGLLLTVRRLLGLTVLSAPSVLLAILGRSLLRLLSVLGLLLTVRRLLGLTVLPAPSVLLAILLLAVRLCGSLSLLGLYVLLLVLLGLCRSLLLFLCCFTGIFFLFGYCKVHAFGNNIESVYFRIVLCTGIRVRLYGPGNTDGISLFQILFCEFGVLAVHNDPEEVRVFIAVLLLPPFRFLVRHFHRKSKSHEFPVCGIVNFRIVCKAPKDV